MTELSSQQRRCAGLALLATLALLPERAAAQEPATFPIERFRPAMDRDGLIDTEWAVVGEHLSYDVTLGLGYAYNPLLLYRRDADGELSRAGPLVQHRLSADLIGAISLFDFVEAGLHVPVTLYQGRGDPTPGAVAGALEAVGLGDLRLIPKVQLLNAGDHFIDLAVLATITFPTGVPTGNYMGEKTVTWAPELIVSRRLPGLKLATNLGVRLRETTQQLGLRVGTEITYKFAAGHRLDYLGLAMEVDASLSGSIAAVNPGQSFNRNPLELLFAGSYDVTDTIVCYTGFGFGIIAGYGTPDARVFAGVRFSPRSGDRDGDSIRDPVDPCPTEAEDVDDWEDDDGCPDLDNDDDDVPDTIDEAPFEPEDGDEFEDGDGLPDPDNDWDGIPDGSDRCPNDSEDYDGDADEDGCPDLDQDRDGIPDEIDACPKDAEDRDGFEDRDGCPDVDNDDDGLAGPDDRCPTQAETINGFEDIDGCPDIEPAVKVRLIAQQFDIRGKVYFDTSKSTLEARSFDLLTQVAEVMKRNPSVTKLQIEGHTDSQGGDEDNMFLSQDRADAVRRFLIKEGVDKDRLVARGFGETKPIASNATRRGRSMNRRVAFTILEMDGTPVAPMAIPGVQP